MFLMACLCFVEFDFETKLQFKNESTCKSTEDESRMGDGEGLWKLY